MKSEKNQKFLKDYSKEREFRKAKEDLNMIEVTNLVADGKEVDHKKASVL